MLIDTNNTDSYTPDLLLCGAMMDMAVSLSMRDGYSPPCSNPVVITATNDTDSSITVVEADPDSLEPVAPTASWRVFLSTIRRITVE